MLLISLMITALVISLDNFLQVTNDFNCL